MVRSGWVFIIVVCSFLAFSSQAAEWISLGDQGSEPALQVRSADQNGLTISFQLSGFSTADIVHNGAAFSQLNFPGSGVWGEFGSPELPTFSRLLRLPDRAGWEWEVTGSDFVELEGFHVAPYQEGRVETPDGPIEPDFVYNQAEYQKNEWFPAHPVGFGDPVIMAGFRLVRLELRPIQYNPSTGKLRVYRQLEVSIHFIGEGENPVTKVRQGHSRVFSQLIEREVINPGVFDFDEEDEVLGGYLVITPPSLENSFWLQSFVLWKRQSGYPVTVVNTNTTGTNASSITSYIQNSVYNVWSVPPDFLLLVGDEDYGMPAHIYSYTGNVTDLPYTLLEGADYFPDILAGRLSVDSENDLAIVCSKSINYEQNPDMVSTNWFTRGLMVYDYNGSLSIQNVKNRCRDLMLAHGYAIVDTVTNPPNYYGASLINPIVNAGVSFINYRGYGSYSGWTPPNYHISDMYSLNNGFRLPVITSIVCGGGNFASTTDPCFGEYWIRRGSSPNNVSGGVAFMGPSSLYTHTKWNNCIDSGVYQGIFEEGIETVAAALLRGKLELYYGMPNNQGGGGTTSSVECYFNIYNILGDPGLRMWTGVPQNLTVDHPAELPLGVNAFDVSVTITGVPVEEALVCLYNQTTGYQIYNWTDENGDVLFDLSGTVAGNYTLTVTGKNLKPYQTTVAIAQQDVALGINNCVLDDDNIGESSGDGDGDVNPGETIEMVVTLENSGSSVTATGISGSISSDDPYLEITENTLTGTSAIPGGTCQLNDDFNLVISAEAPHTHAIPIYLEAICNEGSWTNLVTLQVVAPLAECLDYEVATVSGILNPGEQADITIELMSSGGDPLSNCTATLTSPDGKLVVLDADGSWGTLQPGTSASNDGNPFILQAATSCPPGWVIPLELTVTSDGYCDTLTVSFIVGEINDTDPAGPDSYGYRCFDSRDVGYDQVPLYDWVEASTMPGQETLNLPDYGTEQDKSIVHQLPFTFRYYGVDYNEITICSNGWLSMGDSHNYVSLRNWNIPGALGPPAMIAGFWDDLRQSSGSTSINYWYDSDNHRVFVEWKDLRTVSGSGINRFEVILYDPAYYPTSTGDGEILVQYHTFNNVDASENYCTIGIENWEQSDGVNVTYASHYSRGSAILTAGVALRYTTDIDYSTGAPDVQVSLTPAVSPIQIPATGGSFDFNIAAVNNDPAAASVTFWCDVILPNGSSFGPLLGPVTLTMNAGSSLDRDRTQAIPDYAPEGWYTYRAFAGSYPSMIYSSDSFPFEKVADIYDVPVPNWENDGESFGNELEQMTAALPQEFGLIGVTPNPFNPTTTVTFALSEATRMTLEVYDISGRKVVSLIDGWRDAGYHQVEFDGGNLSSGIYFCRFQAENRHNILKLVLLK